MGSVHLSTQLTALVQELSPAPIFLRSKTPFKKLPPHLPSPCPHRGQSQRWSHPVQKMPTVPKGLHQSKLMGPPGTLLPNNPPSSAQKTVQLDTNRPKDPATCTRSLRSTTDSSLRWSRTSIEELAGQDINSAEEGASYLELNRLTAQAGEYSADDLAGALFQITMLPGIRSNKSGVDAVRAVAYVLAGAALDSKAHDITEAVSACIDTQMDVIRTDMDTLAADAEARAAAASALLKAQIETVAREAAESLQQAIKGMSDTTLKLTETTTRYRDALAGPPPRAPAAGPLLTHLAPRLRAREGIRARQVLLDPDRLGGPATFRDDSLAGIRDEVNKAMSATNGGDPAHRVKAMTKLCNGGILLELNSDEAAEWFADPEARKAFLSHLQGTATIKPRHYNVVVQFIPLTFRPNRDLDLREIKEVNKLDEGELAKAKWIKQ